MNVGEVVEGANVGEMVEGANVGKVVGGSVGATVGAVGASDGDDVVGFSVGMMHTYNSGVRSRINPEPHK